MPQISVYFRNFGGRKETYNNDIKLFNSQAALNYKAKPEVFYIVNESVMGLGIWGGRGASMSQKIFDVNICRFWYI